MTKKKSSLASGTLNTLESTVMGIAGTAPAFTVAVTTAVIVSSVGTLAVGSIFYSGLIMFGIMLAYKHLNKVDPDSGAAFAWVGKIFGPTLGFFAGWGLLVASTVFMVSAAIPAATSTLLLAAPDLVENTNAVTLVAAVWLTLVTAVVLKGIRQSSNIQLALTLFETTIIFGIIALAFIRFGGTPAHAPSLTWFSPMSFTIQSFATGALTAIFFYWGWDVTMNLSEETKTGTPDPAGRGAFFAMVNLILFFVIMMIVVFVVLTDEEIAKANTNVLYAVAEKLLPKPWSYLAVISTVLSTVGTIETQILQFSRTLFSMSRANALHSRYTVVHSKWKTPWLATFVIWFLGMVLLFTSSYMPTVKEILDSSVSAIGFQICFYMSLAGFACSWHYRSKLKDGAFAACSYVIWPGLSALFMVAIALYSIPTFKPVTLMIGVGGLLIGIVPLLSNISRNRRETKLTEVL